MDKIFLYQSAANVQLATNVPLIRSCPFLVNQENTRKLLDKQCANHVQLGRLARIATPYLTVVHLVIHHLLVQHHVLLSQQLLATLRQGLTNLRGQTQELVCFVQKALNVSARTPRHANAFQVTTV